MQLVKYEAARQALQVAKSVDEVKDIRDKAEAMRAYAKQAKDLDMQNWAAEIRIRAERKLGEMISQQREAGLMNKGGKAEQEPYRSHDETSKIPTLADMGISKSMSSRAQAIAKVPDDEFEEVISEHREKQEELTSATIYKLTKDPLATLHTGDEESYTPEKYIESARKVLGSIDLDPASNDMAQATVQAAEYFTIEDDGLSKHWDGNVWMNPPYTARVINEFIAKLVGHYKSGDIKKAIVLTNNNTDTSWFHEGAKSASAICFTAGRINFLKRDGSVSSPTNGQSFFYFGDDVKVFKAEFSKHGLVMVKA